MIQPPQSLLRRAIKAGVEYYRSDNWSAARRESCRIKVQKLYKQVAKAMKAKDENEELMVREELNQKAVSQIENERRKLLGIEGY